MIRRPPRSTLFPYTSSSDLFPPDGPMRQISIPQMRLLKERAQYKPLHGNRRVFQTHLRSEEHTSELQSRRDLVCRLLLEKKKTKNKNYSDEVRTKMNIEHKQ